MCDECLMRRSLIDHILDAHGKELELPVLLDLNRHVQMDGAVLVLSIAPRNGV